MEKVSSAGPAGWARPAGGARSSWRSSPSSTSCRCCSSSSPPSSRRATRSWCRRRCRPPRCSVSSPTSLSSRRRSRISARCSPASMTPGGAPEADRLRPLFLQLDLHRVGRRCCWRWSSARWPPSASRAIR